MTTPAQTAITDLLASNGISYAAVLVQKGAIDPPFGDGKPWEHDSWEVVFSRAGKASLRLPFKTGIGLRKASNLARLQFAGSPKAAFDRRQLEVSAAPVAPHAADVLYSVVMDDTRGESFRNWCANYGYDDDSRRALNIYETCQRQTDDANAFFGRELFEQIGTLLQDY